MALLRRLFARKALDGLLEISDRLYLFNYCLNTKTMGEDEYRYYITSIIIQLKNCYPNSSFMVLNLMEGDRRIQILDILSQYNVKIVDYPRQYERYPILPLETIHDFLRTSDNWLSSEGESNMLLLHCDTGGQCSHSCLPVCYFTDKDTHRRRGCWKWLIDKHRKSFSMYILP